MSKMFKILVTFNAHKDKIKNLVVFDEKYIISSSIQEDSSIKVWDLNEMINNKGDILLV